MAHPRTCTARGWREITETSVVELIQLRNAINEALELDTR